jgi:CheY-like chemotaxis protein
MNILFLDDQQERHDLAEKYLSPYHTLLHCFTADEALEIIQSFQGVIGLAMLDHDLRDELTGRHEDGTSFEKHGMWFVNELISNVPIAKHPPYVIVHSYNPDGGKNMTNTLNKYSDSIHARQEVFSGAMLKRLVAELIQQ